MTTTEVLPLRYGLAATLVSDETDRSDAIARTHAHPSGCTCDRCLKLYGKDGRP